ncbi:hypothetical protein DWB61_14575 [Ancylomarina euxinus]|uniref:Uncharacterized protein n=1 Tax=Ancylomarina euxinus TaxID=2283627 RepID=A0A425XXY3_9BACT|nr:hypothetical protein DWB61_14575 [Ancylomarina euxinus]
MILYIYIIRTKVTHPLHNSNQLRQESLKYSNKPFLFRINLTKFVWLNKMGDKILLETQTFTDLITINHY